jgi:hypothetical protein
LVTVLRACGLSVRIYKDDHPPAHVHVVGDGLAKVDLDADGAQPALLWTRGMTRSEARRALALVTENRGELLARWREIHGA